MAIRDIFKISRKTFFNPSGWIDYDSLKSQNQYLYSTLKTILTPEVPERTETFEEAVKRLHLTEQQLANMISSYHLYALIFAFFGITMFAYSFYLLFGYGSIAGLLIGLCVTGLFFAQAFRYDFWAFQMSRQKLGLTFNDWKRHFLGEKGGAA